MTNKKRRRKKKQPFLEVLKKTKHFFLQKKTKTMGKAQKFTQGKRCMITAYWPEKLAMDRVTEACESLQEWLWETDYVDYAVQQLERCPKTKRLHLQGFWHFNKVVRKSNVVKALTRVGCIGPHLCVPDGTNKEQQIYCTKPESFVGCRFEKGTPPKDQGARTDLEAIKKKIREDCLKANAELEFFRAFPREMLRYDRAVRRWMDLEAKCKRREAGYRMPYVLVVWGPTGVGKSRLAANLCEVKYGLENTYRKPGGPWWSTYDNEEAIIIEEFNGSDMPPLEFLRLCDGFPYEGPIKGGFKTVWPTIIIFTSNTDPEQWWREARERNPTDDKWAAIGRRIDKSLHYRRGLDGHLAVDGVRILELLPESRHETLPDQANADGDRDTTERTGDGTGTSGNAVANGAGAIAESEASIPDTEDAWVIDETILISSDEEEF